MPYILGVSSPPQFTVSGLTFGVSIAAMGLIILTITAVFIIILIRIRKQKINEHDEQQFDSVTDTLATNIDMEKNVAYVTTSEARQSVQTSRD